MRRGVTLVEMALAIAVAGVLAAIALPRLRPALDGIAADAAAREITTALAVTRHSAIRRGRQVRLRIAADSLRMEGWDGASWTALSTWPGPAARHVQLQVSNPVITYAPTGIGRGVSNSTIRLRRGSQIETVTTSRIGRVRRW